MDIVQYMYDNGVCSKELLKFRRWAGNRSSDKLWSSYSNGGNLLYFCMLRRLPVNKIHSIMDELKVLAENRIYQRMLIPAHPDGLTSRAPSGSATNYAVPQQQYTDIVSDILRHRISIIDRLKRRYKALLKHPKDELIDYKTAKKYLELYDERDKLSVNADANQKRINRIKTEISQITTRCREYHDIRLFVRYLVDSLCLHSATNQKQVADIVRSHVSMSDVWRELAPEQLEAE